MFYVSSSSIGESSEKSLNKYPSVTELSGKAIKLIKKVNTEYRICLFTFNKKIMKKLKMKRREGMSIVGIYSRVKECVVFNFIFIWHFLFKEEIFSMVNNFHNSLHRRVKEMLIEFCLWYLIKRTILNSENI